MADATADFKKSIVGKHLIRTRSSLAYCPLEERIQEQKGKGAGEEGMRALQSGERLESARHAKGEGVVVWNVSDNLTSVMEQTT